MILGVLLGLAALAVLTSVFNDGEFERFDLSAQDSELIITFANQGTRASNSGIKPVEASAAITLQEGLDDLVQSARTGDNGLITITEFSKSEDALVYAFDENGKVPDLSLDHSEDSSGAPRDALVFADGKLVAIVKDMGAEFTLEDLVLAPIRAQG